ncbi:MAG: Endo/exonuclease/phosphatase protein [Gammaproteobacteria bacterium]|nr:Endo/exonuclease/phosphatase protein [Gammaproteobacteria bacterium]
MKPFPIKVLTYNLHKGYSSANLRFVLHRMREELHKTDADIIFLQEIQGKHSRREATVREWPLVSQCEFLADQLWPHYAYGKNAIYNAGHHGNAILSKFPFARWENLNVSDLRRASRSLLHGVVRIPDIDRELHIICIHLDLRAYERHRQIKILTQRIRETVPPQAPLILAGDFNDWRGELYKYLPRELDLTEVFRHLHGRHAKTFPAFLPVLSVDRIFYRGVDPIECSCFRDHPWHSLSDHLPLYAKFEMPR